MRRPRSSRKPRQSFFYISRQNKFQRETAPLLAMYAVVLSGCKPLGRVGKQGKKYYLYRLCGENVAFWNMQRKIQPWLRPNPSERLLVYPELAAKS